jgi:hypothetical protein
MLDHLARWESGGGDVMVVELPFATACTDGPGSKGLGLGLGFRLKV